MKHAKFSGIINNFSPPWFAMILVFLIDVPEKDGGARVEGGSHECSSEAKSR